MVAIQYNNSLDNQGKDLNETDPKSAQQSNSLDRDEEEKSVSF